MKKKWFVASYKINDIKRVQANLLNQNFNFYLPKIIVKKPNNILKEEVLFPGYIFINTAFENYSSLKYTLGINKIIKFGNSFAYISKNDIKIMQIAEAKSKINPLTQQIKIGQDVTISNGSLNGVIAKICSLPYKERVDVFFTFLGSKRRISMPIKDITL